MPRPAGGWKLQNSAKVLHVNHNPPLVDELQGRVIEALRSVTRAGEPYALLDFPAHANVGDSAIWLGTVAAIEALGLGPPVYRCDAGTYSRNVLARRIGGGTILLHGGGNFGDVWPLHQHFREKVLADFPETRVVQLPQTVQFESEANAVRCRAAIERHGSFELMVRGEASRAWVSEWLGIDAILVPDMAFGLGRLGRPAAEVDISVLARRDLERSAANEEATGSSPGVVWGDWLDERQSALLRVENLLRRASEERPRRLGWLPRPMDAVARMRLRRGLAMLGRGRAVVTDRLHGHILSLLMGIPHVLVDNSYGKNIRFHETWTAGSPLTCRAATLDEGVRLARKHLLQKP